MRTLCFLLLLWGASPSSLFAQDPAVLNVDRIFSDEFRLEPTPSIKWLADGGYTALVPSEIHKGASDIARYDRSAAREIVLAAQSIIPPGSQEPLPIQGYEFSEDQKMILLYTNSVKVWRRGRIELDVCLTITGWGTCRVRDREQYLCRNYRKW